ncbi:hypothetical protein TSUD_92510 [Trifolium subterraneum]|uniref:Reverse transcriptase domain-containing protein n=1 Tax=Trifolium subterraneum TaxID=3900 RepID=A0A2Z6PHG4_TRISU|nr:hypothetical protein TSUD_92510 [Trifolium subterraneum]
MRVFGHGDEKDVLSDALAEVDCSVCVCVCVCTATASVLVNISPTDEFSLEKGLRQGDPLSPFLFLLAAEGLNVMMRAMVQANLFTGYSVGSENSTIVSHLQFADDTLLLGVKSWANVCALRTILVLFEKVFGLKVNFHKSMLVGVNIGDSWLSEATVVLGCKVGKVPFMYLGLPVGGDPRRLSFWEPVVSSIRTRLSRWKNRLLSFGGRLILLKSVLTSLHVYALSFFKAPSGQDHGGLGVRQLREFNTTLLGKWCWRMLVDKGGMWEGAVGGEWFVESIERRVGNDADTSFWSDLWLGGAPLCVRFRRLFDLSTIQSISVADMCELGWEAGGAGWQWRRQLWVWEEELLLECKGLLYDIVLHANISDSWIWRHDVGGGYYVQCVYYLVTSTDTVSQAGAPDLIWHKHVPLKVSILALRLRRNRLPTKDNLMARNITSLDAHFCVNGCGELETANHLFLAFPIFAPLWTLVRSWLGIAPTTAELLQDHCAQFVASLGGSRIRRSFLQLVWLCCTSILWHERNNRVFKP